MIEDTNDAIMVVASYIKDVTGFTIDKYWELALN